MEGKKKKVPGVPTRTRESVKDERFAQVLRNPVYRPVPKKERKVEIDRRFQGMFNDERFKLKYKVDKRGRPMATATDENMKRYYNLAEGEEEDEERKDKESSDSDESDEDGEDDSEVEGDVKEDDIKSAVPTSRSKIDQITREKLHSQEVDYARGDADFEDESSSDDDDDSSSGEDDEIALLEHDWGELDKDADRTEESTHRLAICNMDWDRVRAQDLMVLLSSFLPPGGIIRKVTIYPSEFGKQRMAEEEKEGPMELRGEPGVKREIDSDEEEEDEEEDEEENEDEDEGKQYHREKLRQYQLNRLRYYYAVAEFDNAATADKVYAECDGMEYESSAAKVDLRFIPDDVSFEDDTPKEVCTEVPDREKYRPRFFTTTALQQVKVDLTWDETDPLRKELTEKIFDPKEKVDDDDIRAYLATSSEEESEDEKEEVEKEEAEVKTEEPNSKKKQDAISKYKALLENIDEQEKKKKAKDVEMEITWGVGLKETTEKLVKKKLKEEEQKNRTPWQELLDKRKEKRQMRKQMKKGGGEDDDDGESDDQEQPFSDDEVDVDMNDDFFKSELQNNDIFKQKKAASKKDKVKTKGTNKDEEETGVKSNAELELLLMDEDDNKRHFSLKKIMEEENDSKTKKKRKRNKLKKKQNSEQEINNATPKDNFEIDVEDNRFSALFNSHHFNVDPSDPNFKKTKAMERIIQEKQRRRATDSDRNGDAANNKKRKVDEISDDHSNGSSKKNADLSYLVKSIKRNTKNLQMNHKLGKKGKS